MFSVIASLSLKATMSNSHSSSSQHILITFAEYERLKNIEEQFENLQKNLHKKLQIPSKFKVQIVGKISLITTKISYKFFLTFSMKFSNVFFRFKRQWFFGD